jgi:hypothetical protein
MFRTPGPWLALLAFVLYAQNWNDYFIGDDFDLIHSFHGKPFGYFPALLWNNESGDVWKVWGLDPELGRGYLRPVKIWLLALDDAIWGTNPLGFHLTSSACFAAVVVLVFAIARRAIPERPELAIAGAVALALHPIFAEVVPFVTTREEVLANALGLASFLAFQRHRDDGRSPWPFHVLYALALLTKESAIIFLAFPVGLDLVNGRLWPLTRERIRDLVRVYAPSAVFLGIYFGLRFLTFGNLVGGDGIELHYLSPSAFLGFHLHFWRSLGDPTLLSIGHLRVGGALAGGLLVLLVAATLACWPRTPLARRRALVFFGPLWYAAATAILHGSYFAVRHNLLPVIGIALFTAVALDNLVAIYRPRAARACAIGLVAAAAALFVPPALATSAEWRTAAAGVAEIRAEIEARTAGQPPGCTVSITGAPQWILPPFFFGWGLRSALSAPFTPSDLARVCTVFDARNRALTKAQDALPDRFDVVIVLDPKRWITPAQRERHLLRLWREGIVARGDRNIP